MLSKASPCLSSLLSWSRVFPGWKKTGFFISKCDHPIAKRWTLLGGKISLGSGLRFI